SLPDRCTRLTPPGVALETSDFRRPYPRQMTGHGMQNHTNPTSTPPDMSRTTARAAFAVTASLLCGALTVPVFAEAATADTGTIPDSEVVTEQELAAVDHVVYAINAGNVTENTNNNPFAGMNVPFGIDRFDYPYETYEQDGLVVPRPVVAFDQTAPFPTALVHGSAPDQEYTDTSNLDWGYVPSTSDN